MKFKRIKNRNELLKHPVLIKTAVFTKNCHWYYRNFLAQYGRWYLIKGCINQSKKQNYTLTKKHSPTGRASVTLSSSTMQLLIRWSDNQNCSFSPEKTIYSYAKTKNTDTSQEKDGCSIETSMTIYLFMNI